MEKTALIKRSVIFILFAACSLAFSQQPQAAYSFDLKEHGFWVKRAVANDTTLGFITENLIGVQIHESHGTASFTKLLIFDIANQRILANRDDFPCFVIWANGNLVCFYARHADIYDENLNLLAHYQPDFNITPGTALNFVARNHMVKVSPDQLLMSVPLGGTTEIVSLRHLSPIHRIPGNIIALGNDRWVAEKSFGSHFKEETYLDSQLIDLRFLPELPIYLNKNALLMNQRRMNIEDEKGHILRRLGKTPVGFEFIAPDRIGRRFVQEVFVAKVWDFSGTAQYKKISLRVFETATGKEIFHMKEVPSEDEPTFEHYAALSPNGTRLAVIRRGVLKIYELPH